MKGGNNKSIMPKFLRDTYVDNKDLFQSATAAVVMAGALKLGANYLQNMDKWVGNTQTNWFVIIYEGMIMNEKDNNIIYSHRYNLVKVYVWESF